MIQIKYASSLANTKNSSKREFIHYFPRSISYFIVI